MVTDEQIEEYYCLHEIWDSEDVICPYCGYDRYRRQKHYKKLETIICDGCGRKFEMTSSIKWIHYLLPLDEEVKKILEEEEKKNGNKK